jgi:hypothetical protein
MNSFKKGDKMDILINIDNVNIFFICLAIVAVVGIKKI